MTSPLKKATNRHSFQAYATQIIALIKRYHAASAFLCVLLAAFSTPYLIPENPDHAVFRSGSLGLILLLGAYAPVRRALERHSPRTLVYGMTFGLFFSICLSLGCEMEVYQKLLPGMGSLLRRIAVPCMITPLIGVLSSYAFAWKPGRNPNFRQIPAWVFFLSFSICYFLIFLALYPGVISYDFEHEIAQYTSGKYLAAHPIFHTLFLGTLYRIGETVFGTMTAGAALYSIVQLLLLAGMYAYVMSFLQRRVRHTFAILLLGMGFALLPFHGVLAVSTSKDPLFAGLCTVLTLMLWEIVENPNSFMQSKGRMIRFSLTCLGLIMLRHNGIFAYLPACVALYFFCRTYRKQAAFLAVFTVVLCLGVPKTAQVALHAQKTPSSELMSIPCQQLMRTANYGNLDEHAFNQIERYFPGATHTYRPHCADPAKGGNFNLDRVQKSPVAFLKTYVKYGLKHPRIYLEAFLANTQGMWYPGDTSHAHSFSTEEGAYIYLNTVYPFEPERYPITPRSLFPSLQKIIYATMHNNVHEDIPVLAQLYCPASYSFGLLLCTLLLLKKKKRRFALCLLPLWGIFISVLFSAGVLIRYAYPLMAAVPPLLLLSFYTE